MNGNLEHIFKGTDNKNITSKTVEMRMLSWEDQTPMVADTHFFVVSETMFLEMNIYYMVEVLGKYMTPSFPTFIDVFRKYLRDLRTLVCYNKKMKRSLMEKLMPTFL